MSGYKHPCNYCEKLIPPDSNVCPLCGKVNPLGPLRCPQCADPIRKDWRNCAHCGLLLEIDCPHCGGATFFGDYCGHCGNRLTVVCANPKCKTEQPPVGSNCVACGAAL